MRLLCRALLAAAVTIAPLAVATPATAAEGLTVAAVEPAPWPLRRDSGTQWHVTVTNGGAEPVNDVALTWSALPPAVSMEVSPAGATIPAGETQSFTLDVATGSAPSGDHPVTFTATSGDGAATGSGATTLRVGDVPGAPGSIGATGGDTTASLTWDAAEPNGGTITSYVVTETRDGATRTFGDVTSGVFTGLTNGLSYAFHVRAVNEFGPGTPTAPSDPVTPAGPPLAVTGVALTPGDGRLAVSWTAANPNGSPLTSYTVRATGLAPVAVSPGATTASLTGLANGSAYTVTVVATNAEGDSPPSAPVTATPFGRPFPPVDVTAVARPASALVSWVPGAANGRPITGYTVTASPGGATATAAADATSVAFGGLTNGVPHSFTVRATNAAGDSPESAPSGQVTPLAPPGQVTGVTATPGELRITVSWTRPADDGGRVEAYEVVSEPGSVELVPGSQTSVELRDLDPATAYTFVVRAVNGAGAGQDSLPSAPVRPIAPDVTPPVVKVPALPLFTSAGSVRLTYSATDQTGVAVYDVRYRAARFDGGFGAYQYPATWQATEARSVTRTLAKGYTYCFSVRAWDERDLASAWSAERCTAAPLDDRSLTASPGWTRGTSTAHYAGTFTASRTKGATLTRTAVQGRRIALLATRCAGCGSVGIYRSGVLVETLPLAASRTLYRQLFVVDLGAVRAGTVTIRALGTSPVYVDGFAVSRV